MPVVDASVAVKWFVEEVDSAFAITLRDAHVYKQTHLVVPDLIIYEVANALLHNPRFTSNETLRAVDTLYDLQMEIVAPTSELVHTAVKLATHHKLTLYDAMYVALAQEIGLELITADMQLYHRINRFSLVRLLH